MKSIIMSSVLTLCYLWSGLAQSANHAPKNIKPSLKKGEFLRFQAKIGEVKGGYCYLTTKKVERVNGELRVLAYLKARTNNFFDKIHHINNRFKSRFGFNMGSPFTYSIDVDQAGSVLRRKVKFHPQGKRGRMHLHAQYKQYRGRPYKRTYRRRSTVPRDTHNLVSALYRARFMKYKKGKTFSFHVYSTGRLWYVEGKMVGYKKIYTIFGAKRAIEIHAKAKRMHKGAKMRHIRIWLSADRQRIPYRIQGHVPFIGVATAELVGYRRSHKSRYIDGTSRRKKKRKNRVWSFLSKF